MRIKHIALFAAAALVALSGVAGEPAASGPAAVQVDVKAAQPHKSYVDPLMTKRMQGVYRLDDGRILRVSEHRRKLYADVGGGAVEIVHVGRDRFEAIGSDLSLDFEGGPHPYAVVLKSGPERRVASSLR